MQERTINNALLALRKQGGMQGKLAEVLLDARGITWTGWAQDTPLRRGDTKRLVIATLKDGPKTSGQLGAVIHKHNRAITPRSARNRAYQALRRLEDKGVVEAVSAGTRFVTWRLTEKA